MDEWVRTLDIAGNFAALLSEASPKTVMTSVDKTKLNAIDDLENLWNNFIFHATV